MASPGSDVAELGRFADRFWEDDAVAVLGEYVGIRCLSPDFDLDWERTGEIERAAGLLAEWAGRRSIPGLTVDVVRRPGLTPVIIAEVPATRCELATLLYGHLDKQPPLGAWREGLDPFRAVRVGEKLYGRGTGDDGYAVFAALGAIESLAAVGAPHGRTVVLIEASEESGSPHLGPYLDEVADRIGPSGPGLVICLDSGCATYDRLWTTTSLRGNVELTVEVQVLTAGVHSGSAGGVVPSSFRLLRQLLSRVEDPGTGRILVPECVADVPQQCRAAAEAMAAELGDLALESFPIVPGLELAGSSVADRLLARTWEPSLAVIGLDGVPSVLDGGNVLRPFTTAKVSLRLPPPVDPDRAGEAVSKVLTADPPQGARVAVDVHSAAPGFDAPPLEPWLDRAVEEASTELFGRRAGAMGEGGTIPFLAELARRFPDAQFLVTGVLGPESNAHGPNEMLDLATAKRITATVAHVLRSAP